MRRARIENAAVDYDDPCWFFFTSGTTGRSKAAVLTHGQMAFVVTNHLADLMPGTTETDASLVVAPLSHGAGVHQLVQTARGVPTILLPSEKFDIAEAFRLIERHRVSNIFTVPTILKMMVEHPAVEKYDHSSLRFVIYAGAPMYREDQKAALNKLGRCWCSISASARSPATSRSCRPICTMWRTARRPASAPAVSSAPACRSRSRATTGAS